MSIAYVVASVILGFAVLGNALKGDALPLIIDSFILALLIYGAIHF